MRAEARCGPQPLLPAPGVEAEAELLAAMVMFFQRLGLGPTDVGLKVSSRKVLQASGVGVEFPAVEACLVGCTGEQLLLRVWQVRCTPCVQLFNVT